MPAEAFKFINTSFRAREHAKFPRERELMRGINRRNDQAHHSRSTFTDLLSRTCIALFASVQRRQYRRDDPRIMKAHSYATGNKGVNAAGELPKIPYCARGGARENFRL